MHPEGLPADAEHFDTVETEQLEYDPARLFATVYRRYKYKRSNTDGSLEFFIANPHEKDKSRPPLPISLLFFKKSLFFIE